MKIIIDNKIPFIKEAVQRIADEVVYVPGKDFTPELVRDADALIIRDPQIDPVEALALKRRIDKSNQDRTDLVELIDSYFLDKYKEVKPLSDATINTESPAWAIDRLSILALKIYHMQQEVERTDTTEEHRLQCQTKLNILLEQRKDLSTAIEQLLVDIEAGRKYMKVYKQMKMYNDPALNPVLYAKK